MLWEIALKKGAEMSGGPWTFSSLRPFIWLWRIALICIVKYCQYPAVRREFSFLTRSKYFRSGLAYNVFSNINTYSSPHTPRSVWSTNFTLFFNNFLCSHIRNRLWYFVLVKFYQPKLWTDWGQNLSNGKIKKICFI